MPNEERVALRERVREFAREEVAPVIAEHYEQRSFPYGIVRRMGELGLFGLPFSEDIGGGGGDHIDLCLAIEELARVDSSVAITIEASVSLGVMLIDRFGSEAQRERWLPALVAGQALAGFALTEPESGSDASAVGTRAEFDRDRDEWVISGRKAFITNSGTDLTSLITVVAVTGADPDTGKELSTIIVPSGTPGLLVKPAYSKLGWCASDTHELVFDQCRVPAENLLGERGRGLAQAMSVLDEGRVAIAALATGLAQGCVDESVRHARHREVFGKPIARHQAIRFTIADMEMRAHTARLAWQDAAQRMVAGRPFKRYAAIAKLHASEAAVANARDAAQVHGGAGFMNESPVSRFWRDAKILEIGEGTSEIQRMVISRDLGL